MANSSSVGKSSVAAAVSKSVSKAIASTVAKSISSRGGGFTQAPNVSLNSGQVASVSPTGKVVNATQNKSPVSSVSAPSLAAKGISNVGTIEPNLSLATGGVGVGVGSQIVSRTQAQPINLRSELAASELPKAGSSGVVERTVRDVRTEYGEGGRVLSQNPVENKQVFYKSREGTLYALPAGALNPAKKAQIESRLSAAERNAPLTASSVSRVSQAVGLGAAQSGVVDVFKEVKVEPAVSVVSNSVPNIASIRNLYSSSPNEVKNIVQSAPSLTPEQQSKLIFSAGETSLEKGFSELAAGVRKANPEGVSLPVAGRITLGDVGSSFVGLVGGGAKLFETAVKAPFIAGKAVVEKITTGKVSPSTQLEAAGNVASFVELSPSSLVINPEKAVSEQKKGTGFVESQVKSVRSPEELKQGAIALLVGGLAGKSVSKSVERLSVGKPISVEQTGNTLITKVVSSPEQNIRKGIFETTATAKTLFGEKVVGTAGGEVKSITTPARSVTVSKGVVVSGKESIPFGNVEFSRELTPGSSVGVQRTYLGTGKGVISNSAVASRTLAVTKGEVFSGGLGGKLPVGARIPISRSAVVSKSAGLESGIKVKSSNIVEEQPSSELPSELYGSNLALFGESGSPSVSVQRQAIKSSVKSFSPSIPSAVSEVVGERAKALQIERGKQISLGIEVIPKSIGGGSVQLENNSELKSGLVSKQKVSTIVALPSTAKSSFVKPTQNVIPVFSVARAERVTPLVASRKVSVTISRELQKPISKPITEPRVNRSTTNEPLFKFVTEPKAITKQKSALDYSTPFPPTFPPSSSIPAGLKGGGGGSSGGADFRKPGVKVGVGKSSKSGLFPSLVSIGKHQQRTGSLFYSAPSSVKLRKSATFRRTGGEVVPVGEQIKEKGLSFLKFKFKRRGQTAIFNLAGLFVVLVFFALSLDSQLVVANLFANNQVTGSFGSVLSTIIIGFFSVLILAGMFLTMISNRSASV